MAFQALRDAQERFTETHRAFAKLREARRDPKSIRERIGEQEKEMQQLADRVEQIRNKVTGKMAPGELAPLRADAERITRAQEAGEGIKLSMEKQRAWLDEQKEKSGSAAARLRELKGIAASGSADALIRQLKEEVAQLRRATNGPGRGPLPCRRAGRLRREAHARLAPRPSLPAGNAPGRSPRRSPRRRTRETATRCDARCFSSPAANSFRLR